MNDNTALDRAVQKIQKLLRLAKDGGATEAEAALAMERAQSIMSEHGLEIATIEARGEVAGTEPRDKAEATGRSHKKWMRDIMDAVAEVNLASVQYVPPYVDRFNDEKHAGRWHIIGRVSSIAATRVMQQYLSATVSRLARERGTPADDVFKQGCAERICERLRERHAKYLREQREQAERAKPTQEHAATGNALVVVMEDFAQKERDLNNDMRRGVAPGTTAREREEERLETEKRRREVREKEAELVARGVDADDAYYLARGWDQEDLDRINARKLAPPVEKTEKEVARETREYQKIMDRARREQFRQEQRTSSNSYRDGRRAAEQVGLDQQIGKK